MSYHGPDYHPEDEVPYRSGTWADEFNTYEEACIYYGADTPAQIEAEQEYELQMHRIEVQDEIEASGPKFGRYRSEYQQWNNPFADMDLPDEIPF
jgi:hypothetical protein